MLKFLIDNPGYVTILRHFAKSIGGIKTLKILSKYEDYYIYQLIQAASQCTDVCKADSEFLRVLRSVAEYRGITRGCEFKPVAKPKERLAPLEDYLSLLDWLVERACELAVKPIRDVVPEEEAKAMYASLVTMPQYSAYRISLYTALRLPARGRVLLLGAGLQEPLDFIRAAEILGVEPKFAAHEIDPDVYHELIKLGSKYGFDVYLGYESVESAVKRHGKFDVVVAQNVLHWATEPHAVFVEAHKFGRELVLSQGVIEGAGAGFVLTYVLGANRPVSWRTVEGWAVSAGWKRKKRWTKYPLYIAEYVAP